MSTTNLVGVPNFIAKTIHKMSLAFMFATVILMIASSLLMPIHRDEAVFLTIGKRMALGDMPYVDYFDHKMPGIYWVGSILFIMFGATHIPARVLMIIIYILSALVLYEILLILRMKRSAIYGGMAYIVLSIWYQGNFFITESFVNLFILLALWLYLRRLESRTNLGVLLLGLLLSTAVMFKQTAIISLAVIVIDVLLAAYKKRQRYFLLAFAIGLLLPLLGLLIWLVNNEALADFWRNAVVFNLTSYPPFPLNITLRRTIPILLPILAWWIPGIVGLFVNIFRKDKYTLIKVLGITLLPVMLTRPYHHYWNLLIPFVIIAALRLISSYKLSYLIWWITLVGVSVYYTVFVTTDVSAQLNDQLKLVRNSNCENVVEIATYLYSDCKPSKYFYEPGTIDY